MFDFTIEQVADMIGLEKKYTNEKIGRSYNVKCPNCDNKGGYHLNIDTVKGVWRCAKCGESGGTIALYVRFGMGEIKYTKRAGRIAVKEISEQLRLGMHTCQEKHNIVPDEEIKLSDTALHEVYSKMLEIPQLQIISEHKRSLVNRGLSESDIIKNEYRSLPYALYFPKGKDATLDEFKKEKIDVLYRECPELKRLGKQNIISGLYIGTYLSKYKKVDLKGVPGFFKIKGMWCFRYTPGILIPIRSIDRKIVGFQIATKSKVKYITLSSKGFDSGTTGTSRVHFPRNNPIIGPDTIIRLTEGPLKADVALSMTNEKNVAYMAILGVNSTKRLEDALKTVSERGCSNIVESLDMDKIININVAKASKKIKNLLKKTGFKFAHLFWDRPTAEKVYESQMSVLNEHNIEVKNSNKDIFLKILDNTLIMNENSIDMSHDWPNKNSKGIDDFLLFHKQT